MLSPHTKRVPPSRVLCVRSHDILYSVSLDWTVPCERAGLLADIAAADQRKHAKLLTTTRCPARFNLDRTFFPGRASCRGRSPACSPAHFRVLCVATSPSHPTAANIEITDSCFDSHNHS